MPSYRELEPGLFELETPAGPLPVTASEAELRSAGHFPASLRQDRYAGATAMGGAGGVGNVPESVPDTGRQTPGAGGAPAQRLDQDLFEGAANAPELEPHAEQRTSVTKETRELRPGVPPTGGKGIRGGGEVKSIEPGEGGGAPVERARFAKVGGRDIRAGFTIAKSALSPEAVEEYEDAEADASIERKLGAQTIADRQGSRAEAVSAELGRQIRREGVAIREQEERNRAQRADYEERQHVIDEERARVERLEVRPEQYWEERGEAAQVIGAIAVLAAAAGAPQFGGRNLAMEAIERNIDKNIERQKERIERRRQGVRERETELERLTALYGSPAAAEEELRDRQRALVQAYGQKMALDAGATDAAEHLRMQFAEWDQERAQGRLARQEALAGHVTEQWAYQPERTIQIGGPRPLKPEARERAVRLPNGQYAFARTKGDAEKVQTQITSGNAVLDGLGKLKSVMGDGQPWDPDKRARAQSIAAALALDIKNADQAGALDAGTQQIVTAMTSDPNDLFNPSAAARIDAAAERQRGKTSGLMRDYLHTDPEATTPISAARPQTVRPE